MRLSTFVIVMTLPAAFQFRLGYGMGPGELETWWGSVSWIFGIPGRGNPRLALLGQEPYYGPVPPRGHPAWEEPILSETRPAIAFAADDDDGDSGVHTGEDLVDGNDRLNKIDHGRGDF